MSMLLHKLRPPKKQSLSEGVFLNFLMWRWLLSSAPFVLSCLDRLKYNAYKPAAALVYYALQCLLHPHARLGRHSGEL